MIHHPGQDLSFIGLGMLGGLLHKLAGPRMCRAFLWLLLTFERERIMNLPGSTTPVILNRPTGPAATIADEGATAASLALAGASTIGSAVAAANGEGDKIAAGLNSFLGFAVPILSAFEPSYADLLTGIGSGLQTILNAVEQHKAATATAA
jgi:hypothetical protein